MSHTTRVPAQSSAPLFAVHVRPSARSRPRPDFNRERERPEETSYFDTSCVPGCVRAEGITIRQVDNESHVVAPVMTAIMLAVVLYKLKLPEAGAPRHSSGWYNPDYLSVRDFGLTVEW